MVKVSTILELVSILLVPSVRTSSVGVSLIIIGFIGWDPYWVLLWPRSSSMSFAYSNGRAPIPAKTSMILKCRCCHHIRRPPDQTLPMHHHPQWEVLKGLSHCTRRVQQKASVLATPCLIERQLSRDAQEFSRLRVLLQRLQCHNHHSSTSRLSGLFISCTIYYTLFSFILWPGLMCFTYLTSHSVVHMLYGVFPGSR